MRLLIGGLLSLRLFCLGCLLMVEAAMAAESLTHPTEDARAIYQAGKVEFVAIQLQDELLLPGLKPQQQQKVHESYPIRNLNQRWKTFDNIEAQPKLLRRMRQYAIRYNLMMWKLENSPQSDRFKYRY